jgi:hypothetical protein
MNYGLEESIRRMIDNVIKERIDKFDIPVEKLRIKE